MSWSNIWYVKLKQNNNNKTKRKEKEKELNAQLWLEMVKWKLISHFGQMHWIGVFTQIIYSWVFSIHGLVLQLMKSVFFFFIIQAVCDLCKDTMMKNKNSTLNIWLFVRFISKAENCTILSKETNCNGSKRKIIFIYAFMEWLIKKQK